MDEDHQRRRSRRTSYTNAANQSIKDSDTTATATLLQKVSSSTVLDSHTSSRALDSSNRLLAASVGASRLRRQSLTANGSSAGHRRDESTSSTTSKDSRHRQTRSRVASHQFWDNGVPTMLPDDEDDAILQDSRRRTQSYDLLEVELQTKEHELKMAAEIGLKLFEKSEASALRVEELQLQVRDLKNHLQELEMENEVMQRRQVAQRQRQEAISKENVKLSSDLAEVHMLKSELDDARAVIQELESALIVAESGIEGNGSFPGRRSSFRSSPTSHGSPSIGNYRGRRKSITEDMEYDEDDDKGRVRVDPAELIKLENQLQTMEQELTTTQEREKEYQMLNKHSRKRTLELEGCNKQLESELEQLQIEIDSNRTHLRLEMTSKSKVQEQLNEDEDIIVMLRDRVSELEDEMQMSETRSRYTSRADVVLDEVREVRGESMLSMMSGAGDVIQQRKDSTIHDEELQNRLVAKLQESTTQLMHAQTELNSAENELQRYKHQYQEWMRKSKPTFAVEGLIDHDRGFVLYKVTLRMKEKSSEEQHEENHKEEQKEIYEFEHRYSEFARFRGDLKRKLFVNNVTVVRLPGLPPKVWGMGRSQSEQIVKQRQVGIQEFLNVMLALSELDKIVRTDFFDWVGWHPSSKNKGEDDSVGGVEEVVVGVVETGKE
jgi:hypothetical protein